MVSTLSAVHLLLIGTASLTLLHVELYALPRRFSCSIFVSGRALKCIADAAYLWETYIDEVEIDGEVHCMYRSGALGRARERLGGSLN